MLLRWLLAAVHLVALAVGTGAIWNRSRLFTVGADAPTLKRLFEADARWGVAAILWLTTGLWRLFAETEKTLGYYTGSKAFWAKMAFFLAVVLLEIGPMMALMRWRGQVKRGEPPDTSRAPLFARISRIQLALVIAMVFAATAMARGLGY